ncbi:MAG: sigma factor-like helix-turn-helix DNA-binding protein [Gammaproteobacteria bacterium]
MTIDSELLDQMADEVIDLRPEETATRLLSEQELMDAVARLPPILQAALLLQKRDGYSYKEIARKLKVSERKVESYLTEAKLRLQTLLGVKE